jgi:hypothetical protein
MPAIGVMAGMFTYYFSTFTLNVMRYFLFILIVLQFACTSKFSKSNYRGIEVSYEIPLFYPDGRHFVKSDTYKVFYYKDFILYDYPYEFDSALNGVRQPVEYRRSIFVHHKDSSFGYNYDKKTLPRDNVRYLVRQILKSIRQETRKLDSMIQLKPDSAYSAGDLFVELYNIRESDDELNHYTVYLTYDSRLNDVNETLSGKLDSAKKKKLVGIDFHFKETYSDVYQMKFPERTISFKMTALPVSAFDSNHVYIKRYETEVLKM